MDDNRKHLEDFADKHLLNCGGCGGMHLDTFDGDCRSDADRYHAIKDFVERNLKDHSHVFSATVCTHKHHTLSAAVECLRRSHRNGSVVRK